MAGIVRAKRGMIIAIGGVVDHVHLLIQIHPSVSVANAFRDLKCNSSLWIHNTFERAAGFAWQDGYAAFTVSRSDVPDVARYVQQQEEHHKRMSFADEWRRLLVAHGFEIEALAKAAGGR